MIEWLGGYDSTGFWILIFALLIAGSVLNAVGNLIVKTTGLGLFIWGGVELVGYLNYYIEKTPNLPEYADMLVMLFAVILVLVVLKMSLYHITTKKDKSSEVDKH